jgi:predicted ribosomally synthesized peptide with nif11-like leader
VSQEDVIALLERVASDEDLRKRLLSVPSAELLVGAANACGFQIQPSGISNVLTDAELEGVGGSATDRTCYGTTDCCHTKRTCFGTTDCCH